MPPLYQPPSDHLPPQGAAITLGLGPRHSLHAARVDVWGGGAARAGRVNTMPGLTCPAQRRVCRLCHLGTHASDPAGLPLSSLGKKRGCCPFPGWLGWSQCGDGVTFPLRHLRAEERLWDHMAIVGWQTVAFQRLHPKPPATVIGHSCCLPSGRLPASATPRPCVAELELHMGSFSRPPPPGMSHLGPFSVPSLPK